MEFNLYSQVSFGVPGLDSLVRKMIIKPLTDVGMDYFGMVVLLCAKQSPQPSMQAK